MRRTLETLASQNNLSFIMICYTFEITNVADTAELVDILMPSVQAVRVTITGTDHE